MGNPKISVIMPVYNCEKYVGEAVSSILCQTCGAFELIIIDDGSTDRTGEIVRGFLGDNRVVYKRSDSNKGIVESLNRGLQVARADIIARMDGDDVAVPDRLEVQYRFLRDNPQIVLVGSFIELIDEDGRQVGHKEFRTGPENIKKVFFYYGPHWHPTIMARKAAVDAVGRYRKEYEHIEDIDLYFRLICSGYETDNIPMSLLKYRVHDDSSDMHFKEKGTLSFQLKKEIIRECGFKPTAADYISMHVHYFLDRILPAKRKRQAEGIVKSIVDHKIRWNSNRDRSGRTAGSGRSC